MSPLPGSQDQASLKNRAGSFLLFLLTIGGTIAVCWFWSLNEARQRISTAGGLLQPVLTALHPEIPPEVRTEFASGFRLTLVENGEPVSESSVRGSDGKLLPLPSLQRTAEAFRQDGFLWYVFPVHRPGEPQAIILLSSELKQLWPSTLQKALILLLLFYGFRYLRRHRQQREIRPGKQLLEEIDALRRDSIDRKVRLSFDNPFKPVADTVNQLVASRERKDRILNEQHHQQQVLLKNMSEGILTLDNDQRITGLNPSAARWLNLGNPQRARGELFYTCCRIPKLLHMIELVGSTGLHEEYLRLERPDREDRIVKVKGSPLIDQDQTMGVLLVLQDVTTLRRLETLRQDFVSNVTHELRTPLTAIKGYAELLVEDEAVPQETRGYLQRILSQSSRMINIIEDLLSLTRIEDPEDSPALSRTELRPLFESVVHLCEEQIGLRNLSIQVECDDDLTADLHPALFEQAVHNLVNNAVKYTYPDTQITLRAVEQDNGILIDVQDQGPGIPEEDQSRIFERFYRVDKARSRAVGGTGLGLSIVKHIILMHGGEVSVTSTPGQGATFRIQLPQVEW